MPRLLARTLLISETTCVEPGKDPAESHGKWRLNAGSEMTTIIEGLNGGKPVRLVVDLATIRPKNPKIQTLFDHDPNNVIGYWDSFTFSNEGVVANLHLMNPANEVEAAALPDVVRTRAMIRDGVPIQVSIGADAGENGSWEKVEGKIQLNGMEYDGSNEPPLYVLRKGEIFESSIVTFGADARTGRLAAKQNTKFPSAKETPMSDMLKVLLGKIPEKHHGLIARCVAGGDDEATIHSKIHAAESDEKDKQIEALKTQCADLQAKLDDYAQKGQEKQEKETAEKVAAKGSTKGVSFKGTDETKSKIDGEESPKIETLSQAMKVMAAKDPTLKGFKLRVAARKAYPDVQEK
jgi:hypothetical protein